jgi:hypothetical protein
METVIEFARTLSAYPAWAKVTCSLFLAGIVFVAIVAYPKADTEANTQDPGEAPAMQATSNNSPGSTFNQAGRDLTIISGASLQAATIRSFTVEQLSIGFHCRPAPHWKVVP